MKEYIKNFDEEKLREAFRIKEAYSKGEMPLAMANAQMKAHVGSLTPAELAYIEQNFQEKVDDECIKEDLEHMLAIYDGVLVEGVESLPNGHPIRNYFDENKEIKTTIEEIEKLFGRKFIKNEWEELFDKLNEYKIHLSRKQNQLYPELEKKGFDRPTTTMWLFDNDIRDKISGLRDQLADGLAPDEFKPQFLEFKEYILDLMEKEENILYPTSLELLNDEIFMDMISGDREIGYCLIKPGQDYEEGLGKEKTLDKVSHFKSSSFEEDLAQLLSKHNINSSWTPDTKMDVKQGRLSLKQINLLFQHLPVDISYVDEDDLVAFYSDTKHRVFPRSKGVIGRKVVNCHPSDSVEIVEEIISKFRNGEQDRAEFWINKPGVFIYILYVAVRDDDGSFRGVLEMMQDCTKIRSLEGSQRLLDWGETIEQTVDKEKESGKITVLKPDTRLETLLEQYPGLREYMIKRSNKFVIMQSPMFKFMVKIATVQIISDKTGIDMETLQKEFTKYIEEIK